MIYTVTFNPSLDYVMRVNALKQTALIAPMKTSS